MQAGHFATKKKENTNKTKKVKRATERNDPDSEARSRPRPEHPDYARMAAAMKRPDTSFGSR